MIKKILILVLLTFSVSSKASQVYDVDYAFSVIKRVMNINISVTDKPIGGVPPLTSRYEDLKKFKERYYDYDISSVKAPNTEYEEYLMANAIISYYNTFFFTYAEDGFRDFIKSYGYDNFIKVEYSKLLNCEKKPHLFLSIDKKSNKFSEKHEMICYGRIF